MNNNRNLYDEKIDMNRFEWRRIELPSDHAFFAPSNHAWEKYTVDKAITVYENKKKKELGTEMHEHACWLIKNKHKMSREKKTFNIYVNDAIAYDMEPEMPLYYSYFCFGTADAISFDGKLLRIFDLKTGDTPAKFDQLFIYAAYFCLMYRIDPNTIDFETRIYQFNDKDIRFPTSEEIEEKINKIIELSDGMLEYVGTKK